MLFVSRLVLILMLIAGSVLMAPMRGQMAGSSQIEICSDGAARMLTVDARGNPVSVRHPCPECIGCAAVGPVSQAGGMSRIASARPLTFTLPQGVAVPGIIAITPAARDPPLLA